MSTEELPASHEKCFLLTSELRPSRVPYRVRYRSLFLAKMPPARPGVCSRRVTSSRIRAWIFLGMEWSVTAEVHDTKQHCFPHHSVKAQLPPMDERMA